MHIGTLELTTRSTQQKPMEERYEPNKIEPKWRDEWERTDLYLTREEPDRPKFYVLEMFPYPSGDGLSVGHLHNYVPCDLIGRYKRMWGFNGMHSVFPLKTMRCSRGCTRKRPSRAMRRTSSAS